MSGTLDSYRAEHDLTLGELLPGDRLVHPDGLEVSDVERVGPVVFVSFTDETATPPRDARVLAGTVWRPMANRRDAKKEGRK